MSMDHEELIGYGLLVAGIFVLALLAVWGFA
jgi:hypothetical protein